MSTSIEFDSTKYLVKKYFKVKISEGRNDRQNLDSMQSIDIGWISIESPPTVPNLYTECHFKHANLMVEQHGRKLLTHDPIHQKENQLLTRSTPADYT